MNKLNNVEAQRVMAVLGETTDKLKFIELLPEQHSDEFLARLEAEGLESLAENIKTQYQLEESLYVMQGGKLQAPNRNSHSCFELRKRVSSSLRNICRLLVNDAEIYDKAITMLRNLPVNEKRPDIDEEEHKGEDVAEGKTESKFESKESVDPSTTVKPNPDLTVHSCTEAVTSLQEVTLRSLGTTVEEETSIFSLMQAKAARAKEIKEDLKTLQLQLNIEQIEKEAILAELDGTLSKVKKELHAISESIRIENDAIEKEKKEKAKLAADAHKENMEKYSKELEECKTKYKVMLEEAEEAEINMRKKKTKGDNEVALAREQYDTSMLLKLQEYDKYKSQYDTELKKLKEFEDHFKRRDEELAMMAEEEAKWQEFLRLEWEKERPVHDGAVAIQKLFRGINGRREASLISKKRGKKK